MKLILSIPYKYPVRLIINKNELKLILNLKYIVMKYPIRLILQIKYPDKYYWSYFDLF